jgi:restriction system protein
MADSKSPPAGLPTFDQLIQPTVRALRDLGGSANIEELNEKLSDLLKLPEEILAFRREGAGMNEVPYRAAWARTYLRRGGFAEPTARGVWTLTQTGRGVSDGELANLPKRVRAEKRGKGKAKQSDNEQAALDSVISAEYSWKEELLRAHPERN